MASTSLGIVDITALGAFVTDPGTGRLNVAPGWGIDTTSGLPYYDPCGPQPGEEAWVRMDANGDLYLEQSATNGFGLEEGARRPVDLLEPTPPARRHWTEQHTKRTPAQAEHLRKQRRRLKNAQRIAHNVGGGTDG